MAFRLPQHALSTVEFRYELPCEANDYTTTLAVMGRSSTKRTNLFTWTETWSRQEANDGMDPTDTMRWWALIALQDRPRDQATWNRQITGHPHGDQLELPWS